MKDLNRIKFLKEQSIIAKELLIDKNNEFFNLVQNLNEIEGIDKKYGVMMYLRGHESIDKEINLIKNRTYDEFDISLQKINVLEEKNLNWIKYNKYFIDTKLLSKSDLVWMISILAGLILGVLYSLINEYNSKKKRVYNKN